jgi:hypothetical protein
MGSLVYVPDVRTPFYMRYNIKSTVDPNFSQTVFVKSQSLPQEAIDVIPIFDDGTTKYVALGYKKVSPSIFITLDSHTEINLLSTGKNGYVLFGEHLEQSEKSLIYELSSRFTGTPIEMTKREISSSLRALFEEGGFDVADCMGKFYYIHEDSRPGRDDRYWVYEAGDTIFGYKRESTSHTILLYIEGTPPKKLNTPNDTQECSTGIILKDSEALEILIDGGAFFSHVFQLCIALYAPLFFDGSEYIGRTFREAMEHYTGNMRIAMMDNKCVYISPNHYSRRRLNVCISQLDGRITRVLGFY